jgi:hypothetical protein
MDMHERRCWHACGMNSALIALRILFYLLFALRTLVVGGHCLWDLH